MQGPPQQSPGQKRSAQGQFLDVTSPSKVPLFQQGSTPQQQWHARQPMQQHLPQQQSPQQYTAPEGHIPSPGLQRGVEGGHGFGQGQCSPQQREQAAQNRQAQQTWQCGSAQSWPANTAANQSPQQQQQHQQQPPASCLRQAQQQLRSSTSPSPQQQWQMHHQASVSSPGQQQGTMPRCSPHNTWAPQQQQWQPHTQQQQGQVPQQQQPQPLAHDGGGLQQQHGCGTQVPHVYAHQQQQQQQQLLQQFQGQQWPPAVQRQQWQHEQSLAPATQQPVPGWQQRQGPQSPPLQQWQQQQQLNSACSPGGPAAAAYATSSNTRWPNTSPIAVTSQAVPNMPSSPANITTPKAAAAATTNPGSTGGSSRRFPSIWRHIRHCFRLQSAVVARDIAFLCQTLGVEEWHVRHEVARLNKWFQLTYPLRLVLEQYGTLDFVSSRTLMQLTHLPPQQLTLLDTWLQEDQAAAAAAAAIPGSSSNAGELTHKPLSTKYSNYWSCRADGSAASTVGVLPPSWAVLQLMLAGRIKWVPAAAAAADMSPVSQAAAGRFTAARHGSYVWQHGPVDAWLCDNTSSSCDAAAAARSMRADQLKRTRHYRNQAKLLLDPTFAQSATASSCSSSAAVLGFGNLEVGFRDEELSHSSSCHLQRHPVLADHDRLIRLTRNRTTAAAAGSSNDGCGKALEGLLTHGVMLAGRRYRRLVQKDVGQSGESLWLLATESVAPEDTSGPTAWPPTNPAAARQMLGAFSSLPSISKQSARGALLVSNTIPFKVAARQMLYIPDIQGPTDAQGNHILPPHNTAAGSSSSSSVEMLMSDGSGFISADVASLVPGISAGEIISGDRGGGVTWPTTPMQVRVFDPHFGAVIAKGTLTPLTDSVLPPGTLVLRASQVKAPTAKHFWSRWVEHWNEMLVWAFQQHQRVRQPQQQQRVGRQPGPAAVVPGGWQQQPQQSLPGVGVQQGPAAAAAPAAGNQESAGSWGSSAGASVGVPQQQQQLPKSASSGSTNSNLLAQATTAAAASSSTRRPILEFIHPQDRPWLQQLWYVHEALQMLDSGSSSSSGTHLGAASVLPPMACRQQQQQIASGPVPANLCSSSNTADAAAGCCCECVIEVVSRAPSGADKSCDLRINKNLLLLLHHAGVPQQVFEEWSDIEQHKLVGIDSSYDKAYAAARAAGDIEVIHKLEALIGVQLQHNTAVPNNSSTNSNTLHPTAGVVHISNGISNLGLATPIAATMQSVVNSGSGVMSFQPDLALKMDLHAIKLRRRQKMANMSLPVPSADDTAAAVRDGVIRAEGNTFTTPGAAGGVRLLGLPDPTCGCVPEGCVAVSPGLVPPTQQAVIYRDPGIHPGDVRRVRVVPYPSQLVLLLPPHFSGAVFLPSTGSSCLGAALAGGDYDGDQYLLLWDERVLRGFRDDDPEPYQGVSGCGGVDRWALCEGVGWEVVEARLTEYYSFCHRVSGTIGETHTLWEAYADKCCVDSAYCINLAGMYYQALDAPKTGKQPEIPGYYRKNPLPGVDIDHLPPWHSRVVKECNRLGKQSGLGAGGSHPEWSNSSTKNSKIVRSLWCRLQDLPPVDYLDPSLLSLDPDLVLQAGPCGVSSDIMEPLVAKWDRLCGEWNSSWAQIMRKNESARSRAEQRSLSIEKSEIQLMLRAKFELELWGGFEAVAAAVAGSGTNIMDRQLMEASACYQAVYRRAKLKQDKLRPLTEKQRIQQIQEQGYEDMPRVAMAWRVAGQYLRVLKALKPQRLQQARVLQDLQCLQQSGGVTSAMGLGGYGLSGILSGRRCELGSIQHPYLAAVVAQQQSRRGQFRGSLTAAAATGGGEL